MEKHSGLRPTLRKRLAREARRLAMECVAGTAPEMDPASFCGCAIGQIILRATGRRPHPLEADSRFFLAIEIDALLPDDRWDTGDGLVSSALRLAVADGDMGAVAFPLLALADALEEA